MQEISSLDFIISLAYWRKMRKNNVLGQRWIGLVPVFGPGPDWNFRHIDYRPQLQPRNS